MVEAILWFTDMNPGREKGLAFKTVTLETRVQERVLISRNSENPGGGATFLLLRFILCVYSLSGFILSQNLFGGCRK
ncbi:MAG: hypothetical protein ACXACD_19750, partial [Candidatus Thorarchaeota archaeon]